MSLPSEIEIHQSVLADKYSTVEYWRAKWRSDMDMVAEAVGLRKNANFGDILGHIDELRLDAFKWREQEDE